MRASCPPQPRGLFHKMQISQVLTKESKTRQVFGQKSPKRNQHYRNNFGEFHFVGESPKVRNESFPLIEFNAVRLPTTHTRSESVSILKFTRRGGNPIPTDHFVVREVNFGKGWLGKQIRSVRNPVVNTSFPLKRVGAKLPSVSTQALSCAPSCSRS